MGSNVFDVRVGDIELVSAKHSFKWKSGEG